MVNLRHVLLVGMVALPPTILAPDALAWTTAINCEGGTPNTQVAQGGPNTWTNTFNLTVYSTAEVGTGSESCKMGINAGTDGWGDWGAIYSFPQQLSVGSQVWIRLSLYVPSSFNYTGNPWLKFMRVHTASPANSNQGYLDLYINPPGGTVWDPSLGADTTNPFTFYYEGAPVIHTVGTSPKNSIATNSWETYEINYVFDTVPKNQGGKGEIRIWKNNQLLADLTDQITLADATTYAESFFLFTYWNGNAPATQSLYVDDVTITTNVPSNRDANGNPFIGAPVMSSAPTKPLVGPAAPSGLIVK